MVALGLSCVVSQEQLHLLQFQILLKFKNNKYNFYNKLQRFARTINRISPRRSVVFCCLPCSRILTREACRLLQVVKVVQVVFHPQQGLSNAKHSISWHPSLYDITCASSVLLMTYRKGLHDCKSCSSCFPYSAGRVGNNSEAKHSAQRSPSMAAETMPPA